MAIIIVIQVLLALHYVNGQDGGSLIATTSGQYKIDNSGSYIPDNKGQYTQHEGTNGGHLESLEIDNVGSTEPPVPLAPLDPVNLDPKVISALIGK